MGSSMDSKVLLNAIRNVTEEMLNALGSSSEPMQVKEVDIVEYNGRMRCAGIEKFNAPSFISVINFYLNAQDAELHKRAKGALVVYVEYENAGKLFKCLGIPIPEDEDDGSMMKACGEFCNLIAEGLKREIIKEGFVDMPISVPVNYKNSIMQGVEFSVDQTTKHELSFFYWKRKAIVVELTLSAIPIKK